MKGEKELTAHGTFWPMGGAEGFCVTAKAGVCVEVLLCYAVVPTPQQGLGSAVPFGDGAIEGWGKGPVVR